MGELTAAVYLRLSSEDPDLKQALKTESNSIKNQRNLVMDFIRKSPRLSGAEILEFCDDGWSGKNFERPGVQEMLGLVRQGKIRCIIVKDISRFGRDYLEVGTYLFYVFPFLGVRFIAVSDGFDSSRAGSADSLETFFKTLLNDYYSRDLSRKVQRAKWQRAKTGKFMSAFAPFGFIKDPEDRGRLKEDPETAWIVRRIFRLGACGEGAASIARTLNQHRIPTPMVYKRRLGCSRTVWPCIREDNVWTEDQIRRILRDERYTGRMVYGKRRRRQAGDSHTVKVSRRDWVISSHTHEGIVTQEEFDQAQASMRAYRERKGGARKRGDWPLRVRCGCCGRRMERAGGKTPYYRCRLWRVAPAYGCVREPVWETDLRELVQKAFGVWAVLGAVPERLIRERRRREEQEEARLLEQLKALKESRRLLERQLRERYEAFVLGAAGKEEYLAAKERAKTGREAGDRQIGELEARLREMALSRQREEGRGDAVWAEKGMAWEVLEEILVYPGGRMELVWNCRDEEGPLLAGIPWQAPEP